MKFFNRAESLEDLKSEYRRLAMENHPDRGGNVETMQEINNEFDIAFRILEKKAPHQSAKSESATEYRRHFYTEFGWAGSRYTPGIRLKDIASIIRGYVKDVYPTWKFSIRTEYYSMGCSLYVSVMEGPIALFNDEGIKNWAATSMWRRNYKITGEETLENYEKNIRERIVEGYFQNWDWYYDYMTEPAKNALNDIHDLVNSYRYDDSDSRIDYFSTNFYHHLEIGKWDKPFKVVQKTSRIQTAHGSKKARRITA